MGKPRRASNRGRCMNHSAVVIAEKAARPHPTMGTANRGGRGAVRKLKGEEGACVRAATHPCCRPSQSGWPHPSGPRQSPCSPARGRRARGGLRGEGGKAGQPSIRAILACIIVRTVVRRHLWVSRAEITLRFPAPIQSPCSISKTQSLQASIDAPGARAPIVRGWGPVMAARGAAAARC